MIQLEQLLEMKKIINRARELVLRQANDDGLWFDTTTASEAYLQNALRELHKVIEGE